MWIRLEDDFFHHPKIKPLAGPTCLFHVQKMCYCGMWLTDGRVPTSEVRGKRQLGHADALTRSGLWHRAKDLRTVCPDCWKMVGGKPGDGWLIHDFLRYNPSKSEVEHKRAATRDWRAQKATQKQNATDNVSPTNGTVGTNDEKATDLGNGSGRALAREILEQAKTSVRGVPVVTNQEVRNEAARAYGRDLDRDEIA